MLVIQFLQAALLLIAMKKYSDIPDWVDWEARSIAVGPARAQAEA